MMIFASMNSEKEICKEIGDRLKHLRLRNGFSSYENFAVEHDLSRMQYWRIEKGLTNLTIRSLVRILNIHRITLEDFFLGFQVYRTDAKRVSSYKNNGKMKSAKKKAKKRK